VKRIAFAGAATLVLVSAMLACGSDEDSAFSEGGPNATTDAGGFTPGMDGGGAVGAVSGVVVLHAAAFPSFRLCFENYPELAPQPDVALMPQANVVGVEVGSVIRLGPLESAPGKVYVIDQRDVRSTPRNPLDRKCRELLDDPAFGLDRKYQLAGEITTPLGVGRVDVLAITGCGNGAWLNELGISSTDCTDWEPTKGSLRARTVPLLPSIAATDTSLPVQLVHMSSLLEQQFSGSEVDVTFGAFDTDGGKPLGQHVATAPPLFEAGGPTTLSVDQTTAATFGSHGFRIALRPTEDASDAGALFFVDQSLAEVQELSFPQTVPTTYYRAASNYALLLLGDPRITRTYADGGANPSYDPRRGVHLLAIPVKEESDAGTDAASDATVPE
jgi:hypothetical protein